MSHPEPSNGALKALRSERQIRKDAEHERDAAQTALVHAERARDEALSKLATTTQALKTARDATQYWQERAAARGLALHSANQTTQTLNRVINERLNNE